MVVSMRAYEGTKVPSNSFWNAENSEESQMEEFVHLYEPGHLRLERM